MTRLCSLYTLHHSSKKHMQELIFFYKKYQSIIIPCLFFLGAIFIFIQIIMPTLSAIGAQRQTLKTEEQKLSDYTNSVTVLNSLDDAQVSKNANIAISALPPSKDVQSIYLALTTSATKAGIILTGFSVSLGDVFGKTSVPQNTTGIPFVVVTVKVEGANIDNIIEFSNELAKVSPLNKVTGANINSGSGDMDIVFYYKPYDLRLINQNVVKPLSESEQLMLNELPQQ